MIVRRSAVGVATTLLAATFFAAFAPEFAAARASADPQSPIPQPVKPKPDDKCPVCGMFVAKYPDFVSEIIFRDGSYAVFDGVKDMMRFYHDLGSAKPPRAPSDIAAIYVNDYYGLTFMDGRAAFYVTGSDVFGPMGREIIPLRTEAEAKTFAADHKGRAILRFAEITPSVLKDID